MIVNYIMDANVYLTLTAFPSLLFSGLAGNAALIMNGVTLSHDKAANTALSTCTGFIALALVVFLSLRLWHILQEQTS